MKNLLVLCFFLATASSQSCFFDFEDSTEMENFELTCNGQIGSWVIKDRNSAGDPPIDVGEKVLTVSGNQATACLQSKLQIEMIPSQKVTIYYFRKKPAYSDPYESTVSLIPSDGGEPLEWKFLTGNEALSPVGEWSSKSKTFSNLDGTFSLQVLLYIGNGKAEVEIDKIVIEDIPPTSVCYVVEKTTTTSSTESTTTTTTTESTTTTDTTTTDSTTTTTDSTTTDSTTTTMDSTTTDSTSTTTDSTTTDSTTTTTDSTTTDSTSTTTDSTTTDSTTTTTDTTTTDSTTSTTDSTTTDSTTDDTSTTGSATPTVTIPTTDSSSTDEIISTTPSEASYPAFSMFYFIIIIAAAGGISLLALSTCMLILRTTGRRSSRRRQSNFPLS